MLEVVGVVVVVGVDCDMRGFVVGWVVLYLRFGFVVVVYVDYYVVYVVFVDFSGVVCVEEYGDFLVNGDCVVYIVVFIECC